MKKLIRHKVFETNSSSCHSLSVANSTELNQTLYPDDSGNIIIELCGEYGWESDRYNSAHSKVDYLGIYARDWGGSKSEEFTQILIDVIKEHTGATDVLITSKQDKYGDRGYIDHQSVEDQNYHYLFSDKETLKVFLFNNLSGFETDNDNHSSYYDD